MTILKKLVFLWLVLCLCLLQSCEIADERLAKKLVKHGGLWQVENLEWSKVQRGLNNFTESGSNATGSFKFHPNGNVEYTYTLGHVERRGVCMWQADFTQLLVTYVDLPDVPLTVLQVVYDIEHSGRNEITLSTTETYTDDLNQTITNTVAIQLKRRK